MKKITLTVALALLVIVQAQAQNETSNLKGVTPPENATAPGRVTTKDFDRLGLKEADLLHFNSKIPSKIPKGQEPPAEDVAYHKEMDKLIQEALGRLEGKATNLNEKPRPPEAAEATE